MHYCEAKFSDDEKCLICSLFSHGVCLLAYLQIEGGIKICGTSKLHSCQFCLFALNQKIPLYKKFEKQRGLSSSFYLEALDALELFNTRNMYTFENIDRTFGDDNDAVKWDGSLTYSKGM